MAKKKKDFSRMKKRGKVWYFQAMINGKRYNTKLSADDDEAIGLRDDYLYEIRKYGEVASDEPEIINEQKIAPLFGQVGLEYYTRLKDLIAKNQQKKSAERNFISIWNKHIRSYFGNTPIDQMNKYSVDEWKLKMDCNPKSTNNRISIIRSIFEYAKDKGYIEKNIMMDVKNLSIEKNDIYPLCLEEVFLFLKNVHRSYRDFFIVAFYTGMRFGEMAGLLWKNVDFKLSRIKVVQSRVDGEDGKTKTKGSCRDVDMIPDVVEAMKRLQARTGDREYVFYDKEDRLMKPDHVREVIWRKGLENAEITYRPLIQTRHTFATLMIDAGEALGWVQKMMGHKTLQMIINRYYAWFKKPTRNDGSAFMAKLEGKEVPQVPLSSTTGHSEQPNLKQLGKVILFTPKLHQKRKKELTPKANSL